MPRPDKVKTRPPEGLRYACGHRAYLSPNGISVRTGVLNNACPDCRDVVYPARRHGPRR